MVDLCDADGTILREAAGNYANIFDDNFTGFAFGTAYTAAQAETLCLHIYNVVEWEGPLGLWASTGTVGALALTADGVDADATLALQYMTDDTGSWRPIWQTGWPRCWRSQHLPPCCCSVCVPRCR